MSVSIDKLKKLRQYSGWSQEKLAEITGLSLRTIQRIENTGNASLESQLAIATAFNVSPGELFDNEQLEIGNGGLNWSGLFGLALCIGLMLWQLILGSVFFLEPISFMLVIGLSIAMSAIALGLDNTLATLAQIRWVIFLPQREVGLQNHLPHLNKLILYCHVAGAISSLVGIIAVCMTPESYQYEYQPAAKNPFMMGIGIALLTSLYGALIAELILRPLKHQIERLLIQHQSHQASHFSAKAL